MSRSGETRLGLTDSQSAQTHPLVCEVHYDDDDSHDCNDDIGHSQKNLPNTSEKRSSLEGLAHVLNPMESLKWVYGPAKVLKLLPLYV